MKRLVSFALALSLLILPSTASAFNVNNVDTYTTNELREIENEREYLYSLIMKQLKAQNAEEYFDEFKYLADNTIQDKYFNSPTVLRAASTVHAPYGGWTHGSNINMEKRETFLDRTKTADFYELTHKKPSEIEFAADYAMSQVIDFLTFDHFSDILDALSTLKDTTVWGIITAGSQCAAMYHTYDKHDAKDVYMIWEWSGTPNMPLLDTKLYPDATYGLYPRVM